MGSPKKLSSFFVPEFEENVSEESVPKGNVMVEAEMELFLGDFSELCAIKNSLKKWVDQQFEKKKVARADYDEFSQLCNKLELTVIRVETRYIASSSREKISACVLEEKLNKIGEKLEQLSRTAPEVPYRKPTYAESVQLSVPIKDSKNEGKIREIKLRKNLSREQVVVVKSKDITPGEPERITSANVKKTIKSSLNNEQSLKIKKAVNVRGGGVLLVIDAAEEVNNVLGDKILKNLNLKVSQSKKVKPKVVIYDVPSELNERDLTLDIYNRNFRNFIGFENFEKDFKPLFKVGPQNKEQVHWVIECSGKMRNAVIYKERIYIEWASCRVKDYISVARCYKCQGFGHVSKHCKKDTNVCGHCAQQGHDIKVCPNKDNKPICVSCKNNKEKDATHNTSDKSCPCYLRAIQKLVDHTDYES